jgi:predicted PurR-regulated permease PerM
MNESVIDIFFRNFFKVSIVIILLSIFFYIMMPFMISIIFGGILAMALAPLLDFFMKRGISRGLSLIIFSFLLGLIGFVPVVGFCVRGSQVIAEQLHESKLEDIKLKFASITHRFINQFSSIYGLDTAYIEKKFNGVVSYSVNFLANLFSAFITELPAILMMGLITTLAVYFFLREADSIRTFFDRYFYFSKKNGQKFITMTKACCREVFFSNIITGILQATIVSVGALIFGIGDFFLVFYATFIASFVPVIGAAPVAALLAVMCFMESQVGTGIGMLVVSAISGVSDNIIRPYLGTLGAVEVHPFIGLMAVIGGVIMFNLPGLFIGPLVASLIFGVIPIILDEYSVLEKK